MKPNELARQGAHDECNCSQQLHTVPVCGSPSKHWCPMCLVVCRFGLGTTAGPVGSTAAAAGADKVSWNNPSKAATTQQQQQPAVLSRGPAAGAAGRLDSWDLDDAGLPDSSPSTLSQGKVQDLLCGHSGAAGLAVSCSMCPLCAGTGHCHTCSCLLY
jgi:hypothetical protein